MRWNKNGYTVTVRINLFAVGDDGGDLCTADPGSSHADIACFVVDALAGVICRSTVTAGITGNAGVDNHCGGRGVVDCPAGDCGVVAWSLSVVDVAIILGPGNPPTLAVISWQWLTQGDADQQTKGALASLLLMLLLAAYVLLGYLLWRGWRRTIPRVDGVRKPATPLLPGNTLASFLPLTGVLCVVLLAILADQSTINSEALINSLTMGLVAAFIALLLLLLWLEWGPQRRRLWLWLPILLPALPLVAGQYTLALWLNLDGSWTAVVWGYLLWVMPWMLFILQPAWQRIDSRLILIAQTLGWSRSKIFFYVKCPLMLRPTLIAFAVGFSVSIAQYMPTLWLGAGRFPTLTTEAVALSSGGSNGILAAQALWQLLLPLIIFALTALVAKWVGYVRQGLR